MLESESSTIEVMLLPSDEFIYSAVPHAASSLCLPSHSDLKPSNIGLCGQGHVKVFDLGLSVVKDVVGSSTEAYEVNNC